MEIELSNGTVLELPDNTPPEAARNYALRAEAKLKTAADNQAARTQAEGMLSPAPPPVEAPATNMFGGTPVLDRFGLKGVREAAGGVLNHELGVPGWIGRGLLGKVPAVGLGDAAASVNNIISRRGPGEAIDLGSTPSSMGSADAMTMFGNTGVPIPELPYPSQIVGDAIGVPRQAADAGYGERIAESILSFGRGPGAAGRGAVGTTGARAASPVTQRVVNTAGRAAGGTGAVLGSDLGIYTAEAAGLDPELGALMGGIVGGTAPAAINQGPVRLATQNAIADPGPGGGSVLTPNAGSTAAVELADRVGVTPSPGLVGNQSAARLENTAAGIPIVGQGVRNRQNEQLREFQGGLYGETEAMGGTQGGEAPGVDYLGDRMKLLAQRGEANRRAEFDQGYAEVDRGVPPDIHVQPVETYLAAERIVNPRIQDPNYQGESAESRAGVAASLERNLEPQLRENIRVDEYPGAPTPGGNGGPPMPQPTPVRELGIPYRDVRPTSNTLWYTAEGTANPASAAAQEQVRGGLLADQARTLMEHPQMVEAFPDPAERAAKVEQLQVLTREYRQEHATDTVGTGHPMVHPGTGEELGGGAFPVLERLQNAPSEKSAYTQGAQPRTMQVLQRTNPEDYSGLAGDVIAQQSQSRTPFGDLNVSPVVFSRWWESLGPNQRAIFANDDPARIARLNDRSDMGDRFRQRSFTENYSNTSPMMSTIGALVAASADPAMVVQKGFGAMAAAAGVSSDTLARYLARANPQAAAQMMQRGLDALRASGGIVADERYRAGGGAP